MFILKIRKRYDIDAIKDSVSIEEIVDHFGIEKEKQGSRVYVLCPFHSDEHFGSAILWNNGIMCWVCARYYSIFDVYMEMANLSFPETLRQISENWSLNVGYLEDKERFPFSSAELMVVGLLPQNRKCERYPICCLEEPIKIKGYTCEKEVSEIRDGGVVTAIEESYCFSKKGVSMLTHLKDLYREERNMFNWLLEEKSKEAYKRNLVNYRFLCALDEILKREGIDDFLVYTMKILSLHYAVACKNVFQKLKGL